MARKSLLLVILALSFLTVVGQAQTAPSLDLAARVGHQRALEEVYWQQRTWPRENPTAKPSLDAVLSPEQLQARAEDGLRLSNALQKYWGLTITGAQLQSEMERMAHNSRQPDVLRQLFAALNNDAAVIAEMLARPLVAERLARSFYQSDERFDSTKVPFDTWWARVRDSIPVSVADLGFSYILPAINSRLQTDATSESWRSLYAQPEGDISIQAVWTGTEMIVWSGLPPGGAGGLRNGARYNPATDSWRSTAGAGAPMGRLQYTAVWTGTEMIVWGGCGADLPEHNCETATGSRYNPTTEAWTPTNLAGAASPRINHSAVWTGTEMIVWGGCAFINDACRASQVGTSGGRYNPATDSWAPTNTGGAPTERTLHTAVWTGSKMIVWGGFDSVALNTGAVYDPANDSWTPTAALPNSFARFFHTAVWTGREMIIWGGSNNTAELGTGARYNPVLNAWKAVPTNGAPSARASHAGVWTGTQMVVWGGVKGATFPRTGGRYNPATNTWTPTTTLNAPQGRQAPAYVWTGSLMIVWGGQIRTGGRYDPVADAWTPTNPSEAPSAREWHTTVWTGTEMIIWGGDDRLNGTVKTGGRYTPATDTWLPTLVTGAPSPRHLHNAVWTGTEMLVYGGAYGSTIATAYARYNPASNTWKRTSTQGAPVRRSDSSAVWTGTEMIVFGGSVNSGPWTNTGGRYNPTTDTWKLTSTTNAPSGRELASMVWTGSEVIVWGGYTSTAETNTGGRYNPANDTWTPTSLTKAPSARTFPAAVWTGSKMVIWGGATNTSGSFADTGAQYDPANNSWTPTTVAGAPSARGRFAYVWTGSELIIWSGTSNSGRDEVTGGRYNPASDSWADTLTLGAPSARDNFAGVWTGDEMIVWGGVDDKNGTYTFTGGAYTPGP